MIPIAIRPSWIKTPFTLLLLVFGGGVYGADPFEGGAGPVEGDVDAPCRHDWPQWGGSPLRNNVSDATNIPVHWDPGDWDRDTGTWTRQPGENVKWVAEVDTRVGPPNLFSGPAVAGGRIFIGSNDSPARTTRAPRPDMATLVCLQEQDGKFLWQFSAPPDPDAPVSDTLDDKRDRPLNALSGTPYVVGNRLWLLTNRSEVVCLDAEGFYDRDNDGPYRREPAASLDEADVVWRFDLMDRLGVVPHEAARCSLTGVGETIFLGTSNGTDATHSRVPAPAAPSFLAMDKEAAHVLWADHSPGGNILHGQWSSPAYAVLGGVPQVIFGGGDGWLYSFNLHGENGKPRWLWKFDCNPKLPRPGKDRLWRRHVIATPVIHDGLVYASIGEDPEHGEGPGHLWCIDPTRRGDVSVELVFNRNNPEIPAPLKRLEAVVREDGDVVLPNPNSAAVWHYGDTDAEGIDLIRFEESMHRTTNSPAIKDGLLFITDFSGLLHCFDAKTGKRHWCYDMLAPCTNSPLIAGDYVYAGDEDGDIAVFRVSADSAVATNQGQPLAEMNMSNPIMGTPVVANGVLYITTTRFLFAIAEGRK